MEERQKKRKRIAELLALITEHAIDCGLGVATYNRVDIRQALGLSARASKDKVAIAIVKRVPKLAARRPKARRSWEPERYAMPIFTAAGLGLTHLSRAQRRVAG